MPFYPMRTDVNLNFVKGFPLMNEYDEYAVFNISTILFILPFSFFASTCF